MVLDLSFSKRPDGVQIKRIQSLHRPNHPKQNRGLDSTLVRLTLRRHGAIALNREKRVF
jgi:hypothetical protein